MTKPTRYVPDRDRIARFTLVGCLLLPVVLSVACSRLGPAPNVLIVTLDTTRADRIGCYGYSAGSTPALDALAAEGVRFDRAYANVPLTLPSHVTLMTGTFPAVNGLHVNAEGRLPRGLTTLAQRFESSGYATGAFVSSFVLDAAFGLDRGFERYDDRMGDDRPSARFQAERTADTTTDAALDWLEQESDRPFFAWVHYYDPHTPYEPPAAYAATTTDPYDGEIAFVDAQLGRLVSWLESTGQRERTLIVVVGDHGESLGEHGEPEHGLFVYDATMRVPLVMSWPGTLPAGAVAAEPVQMVDLFSTVVELCGLGDRRADTDGRSLVATIDGEAETRAVTGESLYGEIGYGWAPLEFVVDRQTKYIEAPEPELYDLRDDPGETRNLAAALPGRVAQLAESLREHRARLEPLEIDEVQLDRDAIAKLESLGYLGGRSAASTAVDRDDLPDPKDMVGVMRDHARANALLSAGRYAEAARLLEGLVALSPGSFDLYEDLGWAYLGVGRNAEAERAYLESLRNLPGHAERLWGLAEALRRQGKWPSAIEVYDSALVQRPSMGETHMGLALSYAALEQPAKALEHAEKHAEINPASAVAWTNVARLGAQAGRHDRAIEAAQRLLELAPDDPQAHFTRWSTLNTAGEQEREVDALRESLERFPDDWLFVSLLGWRLAVSDGSDGVELDEALALGERAVALDPNHPRSYDVLAAARAATGSFDGAVAAAETAFDLAGAVQMPALRAEIGRRIALYEVGRPYRE